MADLLNLEVDLLFFDTTSTYFERDTQESGDDAFRVYGHSKDHRNDLPQIVIGLHRNALLGHGHRIAASLLLPGQHHTRRRGGGHFIAGMRMRGPRCETTSGAGVWAGSSRWWTAASPPPRTWPTCALGYKNLLEAERGFRDLTSNLLLRPVFHRLEHRIRAHVLLCWLALRRRTRLAASTTQSRGDVTGNAVRFGEQVDLYVVYTACPIVANDRSTPSPNPVRDRARNRDGEFGLVGGVWANNSAIEFAKPLAIVVSTGSGEMTMSGILLRILGSPHRWSTTGPRQSATALAFTPATPSAAGFEFHGTSRPDCPKQSMTLD